jgi:hypothetical protein
MSIIVAEVACAMPAIVRLSRRIQWRFSTYGGIMLFIFTLYFNDFFQKKFIIYLYKRTK